VISVHYEPAGRLAGSVSTIDGILGSGPGIHIGLAAADGLLAVPAGGFLTVYTN